MTTDPNGCMWCGRGALSHGWYFTNRRGWHQYESPTDEQRLDRMRERRAER